MSLEIVEAVRVKYPTPLGASHGAFLIELARTLGGGAGLLAKDWGTFVRLPDGRGVAQDIICYRVPGGATHFDCLGDGEGAATPAWHEIGPIDPARYVDVGTVPVPEPPQPEPPTPPQPQPQPPAPVLCGAAEVLDALHEMRLENAERYDAMLSILARIEDANRKPRPFTGSARFIGRIEGEVGGIEG